ncbi:tail fiber protein [bacterium]|nr:tail fiber protein [bacterium]
MAKKIEILENTLLKLLVRRGDDLDRQNITLSEGELGYTTDGKRLFVGDGQTQGGIIVGNKWKGSVSDISTVTGAISGDYAFENSSSIFYVWTGSAWLEASKILSAGNTTIDIDQVNSTIVVGTISGANISPNALGNSIELSNNQVSLSSTQIKTDRISSHTASHLKLPQDININNVNYQFPVGGLGGANSFLRADGSGNLTWASPAATSTLYFNTSSAIPIGTIVPTASGMSMPGGYLLCNGQTVASTSYPDLYDVIGHQYGGNATNFNLPDYRNSTLYGVESDPASGTEYTLETGTAALKSKAVTYFIKALPDATGTTQFTVSGNIVASLDGVTIDEGESFDPFDGAVVLSTPVPGVTIFDTAGEDTFTTRATYTKFWVTGSGASGGQTNGGAAATVTGILSAPIGTDIYLRVGTGQISRGATGNPSYIRVNSITGTEVARSFGAQTFTTGDPPTPSGETNTGTLSTKGTGFVGGESDYILGGHIIPGSGGGLDTNHVGEEVTGASSFWGGDNVPGAGGHGHNGNVSQHGVTSDGLVKFEWGL